MPVLPLRFGTILTNEDAVPRTCWRPIMTSAPLLSISLRGRTEFQVKARYVKDAVLDEVLSQNKQAAGLWEAIQGS